MSHPEFDAVGEFSSLEMAIKEVGETLNSLPGSILQVLVAG